MTKNTTFRKIADRTRQSSFVLPLFVVFAALFVISLVIGYEDIMTSKWGYEALPTQTGFGITVWAVALLPSLGQLATGYVVVALAQNEQDRFYSVICSGIWFLLFLVDFLTDIYFRNGFIWSADFDVLLVSIFQTIFIFTLGSEFFFVLGFGMMMELLPDAIVETFALGHKINQSWSSRYKKAENHYQQKQQSQKGNNNNQKQNNSGQRMS